MDCLLTALKGTGSCIQISDIFCVCSMYHLLQLYRLKVINVENLLHVIYVPRCVPLLGEYALFVELFVMVTKSLSHGADDERSYLLRRRIDGIK